MESEESGDTGATTMQLVGLSVGWCVSCRGGQTFSQVLMHCNETFMHVEHLVKMFLTFLVPVSLQSVELFVRECICVCVLM